MSTTPALMKAAVITAFGGPEVIAIKQVSPPVLIPGVDDDGVIIRVQAASFNLADAIARKGNLQRVLMLPMPDAILGCDVAGIIIAAGPAARIRASRGADGMKTASVGDAVYGAMIRPTGHGTHAEFVKLSTTRDFVCKLPAHLTPAQGAVIGIAALTACTGLTFPGGLSTSLPIDSSSSSNTTGSKSVLVVGASGGVGSWACQIAKRFGAKVTGVASGKNHSFLRQLGVDRAVDYTAAPLDKQLTTPEEFDVIFDAVGGSTAWNLGSIVLKKKGLFVTSCGSLEISTNVSLGAVVPMMATMAWRSFLGSRKYKQIVSLDLAAFDQVKEWLEDGSLKPVVHSTISLTDVTELPSCTDLQTLCGLSAKLQF